MDGVIAADGKRVAVAGGHPDFKFRVCDLNSGGDRRRAAMNGVESKRIHVVRKTARAADSRNNDELLAGNSQLGKDSLDRGQNGIISAAGAPADFLVGLKIFFRQNWNCGAHLFPYLPFLPAPIAP